MKLSTSTGDFGGYVGPIAQKIREFKGGQFKYINLEQGGDCFLSDNDDDYKKKIEEWGEAAAYAGVKFVVSHSPCVNPFGELNDEYYQKMLRAIRRSIEVCGKLGIERTVVHAGQSRHFTGYEFMKENKRFYTDLFDLCEKYNVTVMTENMDTFTYYPLSTGKEVRELADFVDHPLMGVCWDIAHANINKKVKREGQYKCITDIGDKLKGLHVADNFGDGPHHHTWPFAGIVNWDEIMQALIDVKYDGYFNYEASYTLMHSTNVPFHRQPWDHNGETVTTLLNPSIELKKKAVDLLYECGKYILETYNVFEQ